LIAFLFHVAHGGPSNSMGWLPPVSQQNPSACNVIFANPEAKYHIVVITGLRQYM